MDSHYCSGNPITENIATFNKQTIYTFSSFPAYSLYEIPPYNNAAKIIYAINHKCLCFCCSSQEHDTKRAITVETKNITISADLSRDTIASHQSNAKNGGTAMAKKEITVPIIQLPSLGILFAYLSFPISLTTSYLPGNSYPPKSK